MIPEKKRPYLHQPTDRPRWDWWGENPVEIILVAFILILFFFFHSLPPQGWSIDDRDPADRPAAQATH